MGTKPQKAPARRRIGILGGTFNPIHNGHLKIAEYALKKFKLDKIIFIPTGTPPHKPKTNLLDRKTRYALVKQAIEPHKKFEASPIEIKRPGYSFAVDTFSILKKKFGARTDLFYIMGLDSLTDILNWRQPFRLFDYCEFIVASRPGSSYRVLRRLMKFPPLQKNADKIHLIELNMRYSSTEIRERLKRKKPITALVPSPVLTYFKKTPAEAFQS